jgi:hypothetical protein
MTTVVGDYHWPLIAEHLDAHGWALLPKLLTASECATMAGLYTDDRLFRSHIVMARHGFGRGEYKYFTYPLPDRVTVPPHGALPAPGSDRQPVERIVGTR